MNKTKYKFDKNSRYMTKGINSDMPLEIQILLWSMVDQLVEGEVAADYLQVFKFHQENQRLIIKHGQEQPDYSNKYTLKMKEDFKVLVGKTVYIIDDLDHSTMLFSTEY